MLSIFLSTLVVSTVLFFILDNTKENIKENSRGEKNRDLFKKESLRIKGNKETSYDVSNLLLEERELTLLQDLSKEGNSVYQNIPSTKGLSLSIAFVVFLSILALYSKPVELGSSFDLYAQYELQQFFIDPGGLQDSEKKEILNLLEEYFEKDKISLSGWYLLAYKFNEIEEYKFSALVYKKMIEIFPNEIPLNTFSDYAQTLFMLDGNIFTPRVKLALEAAFNTTPKHPVTLTLKGMQEYQQGKLEVAKGYWEDALDNMSNDSERKSLESALSALYLNKNQ
tara:strand:- start:748 stop:1593 length:846 start_codon:yes stop_codon:yes gene_type:complete